MTTALTPITSIQPTTDTAVPAVPSHAVSDAAFGGATVGLTLADLARIADAISVKRADFTRAVYTSAWRRWDRGVHRAL